MNAIIEGHPIWDAIARAYFALRMWPYPTGTQGRIHARVDGLAALAARGQRRSALRTPRSGGPWQPKRSQRGSRTAGDELGR